MKPARHSAVMQAASAAAIQPQLTRAPHKPAASGQALQASKYETQFFQRDPEGKRPPILMTRPVLVPNEKLLRDCRSVQDTLSSRELEIFQQLWKRGGTADDGVAFRDVACSQHDLLAITTCRTVKTVERAIRNLVAKLHIQILTEADRASRTPRTYRVWRMPQALERARKAGFAVFATRNQVLLVRQRRPEGTPPI